MFADFIQSRRLRMKIFGMSRRRKNVVGFLVRLQSWNCCRYCWLTGLLRLNNNDGFFNGWSFQVKSSLRLHFAKKWHLVNTTTIAVVVNLVHLP